MVCSVEKKKQHRWIAAGLSGSAELLLGSAKQPFIPGAEQQAQNTDGACSGVCQQGFDWPCLGYCALAVNMSSLQTPLRGAGRTILTPHAGSKCHCVPHFWHCWAYSKQGEQAAKKSKHNRCPAWITAFPGRKAQSGGWEQAEHRVLNPEPPPKGCIRELCNANVYGAYSCWVASTYGN